MNNSGSMKKTVALVLMLSLFLSLLLVPSSAADGLKTNVLVYMVGSDLESHDKSATRDLNEMVRGAKSFGEELKLIVYGGGTQNWHNNIFSSEENRCVKIDKNGAELLYSEETRDMTDKATLSDFIRYCGEHYPADRNILIMWDHGGGFLGFGADELHDYDKPMSVRDLQTALGQGGIHFDVIGFDACMMATVEVGYVLSDFCDYMVASEEMEITDGWDYKKWLSALGGEPELGSVELCKMIVDTYMDWCKVNAVGIKSTLSVIDLKKLAGGVPQALGEFAEEMLNNLLEGEYNVVSVQKAIFSNICRANRVNMTDAIEFAGSVKNWPAKKLERALRECVIYNRKYPANLKMNGISIHIPGETNTNARHDIDNIDYLREIGIEECYLEWIKCYRKFIDYGRGKKKERTLNDILNNTVSNEYDEAIYDIVSKNKLDMTGCYVMEDENLTPVLVMPEEKKEYVLYICQSLFRREGNAVINYGGFYFEPDDFPIQYSTDYWKHMCDDWLYINDILCPFHMEDKTMLASARTALYGYTKMCCNGDLGALYIRIIYDHKDGSITVEPLCFQETSLVKNEMQYGRIVPVSEIDPESTVYICCSDYSREKREMPVKRLTKDMKWGDVTKFEWKNTEEVDALGTAYLAIDLYNNVYDFARK